MVHDKLQRMELSVLLELATTYKPRLKWDVKSKWCRYCGSRGAYLWYDSPWGNYKLCKKHHDEWENEQIDINDIDEPKDIKHAINPSDNQEKQYLIEIIMDYATNIENIQYPQIDKIQTHKFKVMQCVETIVIIKIIIIIVIIQK